MSERALRPQLYLRLSFVRAGSEEEPRLRQSVRRYARLRDYATAVREKRVPSRDFFLPGERERELNFRASALARVSESELRGRADVFPRP